MSNIMNKFNILFFFSLFVCFIHFSVAENENIGWPIDFEYNSKSLPSIEVKLSPPENPLPQVAAEIKILESARLKLEEDMMQKLEDEYNKSLVTSKLRIKETIDKTLSIFNDQDVLGSIISHVIKPLRKSYLRKQDSDKKIENISHNETELELNNKDKNGPLPIPEPREQTSFIDQTNFNKSIPSIQISMSEMSEPDIAIKEKIEEIEQYRTDEEIMMFEAAISEMSSLREITILELEKQLQLHLNPFLVDRKIVSRTLEKQLKELEKREETEKMKENMQNQSSFIEQENETEDIGNILNIKISQDDSNYPTIDELVMQMQKRRDTTENLARQKILDLEMKLLKAQSEMIKESLHFSISKIIAQYSPVVETLKIETLKNI